MAGVTLLLAGLWACMNWLWWIFVG